MDKITTCPTISKDNRKKINKSRHPTNIVLTEDDGWHCGLCYANGCCQGLCPPMEWMARRVEVEPCNEGPPVDPASIADTLKPVPWTSNLSTKDLALKIFFMDDKNQSEIAKELGISRQYVNKILNNYEYKIVPKHHK